MMPAVDASRWMAWSIDRVILTLLFLAGALYYNSIQIHHDVAWYVYCNLRQLEGMRPYVDFIEVNPPISFYLTMLPVAFAAATGLPVKICIIVFVLGLTAGVLRLSLAMDSETTPMERRWKSVVGAAILIVTPLAVFAQREHFAVLLGLPYFYLCGARLRRQKVPRHLAVVAGLMAGIGLSIKPYFLLASFAVEAYLVLAQRSPRAVLRPEIYAAVTAGVLHAMFAVLVHPEYFTLAVPLILAAYDAYTAPLSWIAAQPWNAAIILGMAFWLLMRRRADGPLVADALVAATCGFVMCVVVQQKGWAYQSLPAGITLAFAGLELSALALGGRAPFAGLSARQKWTLPAAPLALILVQAILSGPYRNALAVEAAPYVERYAAGGSIFVMSSNLSTGFPLALETEVTWASRFATQWLVPIIVRQQQAGAAQSGEEGEKLARLAQYDVDAVVADFEKFKPDLVFVDRYYEDFISRLYQGVSINLLDYYRRDQRFENLWRDYRMVGTIAAAPPANERRLDVWIRQAATNP